MKPLRLRAVDDDDLEVFATVLHSARMPLAEVAWLGEERRFAALFRRFCYERADGATQQVECALVLERVRSTEVGDLEGLGGAGEAELMTIVSRTGRQGGSSITLIFCCGGFIRLDAEAIEGRLADTGTPGPARDVPRYAAAGGRTDGA